MSGIIFHGRGEMRRNLALLFIYLLGVIETIKGEFVSGEKASLRKCPSFTDKRTNLNEFRNNYGLSLTIPANLSSRGEVLRFTLEPGSLKCEGGTYMEVSFAQGRVLSPSEINSNSWARDFQEFEEARKPLPEHFTSDGHFFHEDYFFSPKADFCVHSINDSKLELLLCPQKCDGRSKNKICIPKCCAIDEAFLWKKCVKLSKTPGKNIYWKPELYEKRWHGGYDKEAQVDFHKNAKFFYTHFPFDCNAGPGYDPGANKSVGEDMGGANMIYDYEGNDTDYDYDAPFLKSYSSVVIHHPHGNQFTSKDPVRLTIDKNGNVKPMLLYTATRKWIVEENLHFCVDAAVINGKDDNGNHQIKPDSYRIFYCSPPDEDEDLDPSQAYKKSMVYTTCSMFSMPFLILTVVIYFTILDKLNLHGLTILSYSISEFMAFMLLITAHFIFLTFSDEGIEWIGIHERGWPCYLIAVSAHFFFLSSYTWLIVMNFDLWMTFRCLRPSRKDSKELKKFFLYSVVAWGVPLIVISCFMILDKVYRDSATEVPVPDYATSTCFVSPEFRGYYVHLPVAVLISCNIVLILLTMKFFFDARGTSARVNAAQFSAKLFAKLFIVMGGASLVDFLSWYYTDTQEKKPWAVVILESVSYLVPIALFYLFCLNDRTQSQLQDKFPRLKVWCSPLRKFFKRGEDESRSTDATMATDSVTYKNDKIRLNTLRNPKENSSSSSN